MNDINKEKPQTAVTNEHHDDLALSSVLYNNNPRNLNQLSNDKDLKQQFSDYIDLTLESAHAQESETQGIIKRKDSDNQIGQSTLIDLTKPQETVKQNNDSNINLKSSVIDLTQPVAAVDACTGATQSTHDIEVELLRIKKRKLISYDSTMVNFDCAICLDNKIERWKGYSLGTCCHTFCVLCLANYVQLSTTTQIRCPNCPSLIQSLDVQSVLVAVGKISEWENYSKKASFELLDKEIMMGENHDEETDELHQEDNQGKEITMRCPAEHCNYTFVYLRNPELQEGTRFDCLQCTGSFCLHCGANSDKIGPAHGGTCHERRQELLKKEVERRKLEEWKKENSKADAKFNELLEKEYTSGVTKPCPKCNSPITKNGGCDHMHCSSCGVQYNWSQAVKK